MALCQKFARNCARATSRRPPAQLSAAPAACAVAWGHEVLRGDVNHPSIDGKDGSPVRFRRGVPHQNLSSGRSCAPASCMVCRTRGAGWLAIGRPAAAGTSTRRPCRRNPRFRTAHRRFGRDRGGGPQGASSVSATQPSWGPHWPVMWSDSVTSWYRRGGRCGRDASPPAYAADHGSDEEDRHSRR